MPQRPHSASRPDLPPLVVRAQPGPESRPYVVGGNVRHSNPTPEANVATRQDLPPSERQENAPVKLIPPAPARSTGPIEATTDQFTAATPFGPAVPIDAPSLRSGLPAYLKNYDLVSIHGQRGFYAHLDGDKMHAFLIPDRFVRRNAAGEIVSFGVDEPNLPKGQQFTTSDPNFRPWQANAPTSAWEVTGGAIIIGACILAAVMFKKWGWV